MASNTKRRKRILLIVGCVLSVVAALVGAMMWRQRRLDQDALAAGRKGRAAIERKNYKVAVDQLGIYLRRWGDRGATAQDYVLLARARQQVSQQGDKHVTASMKLLRKALEIDPTNAEARWELLQIYSKLRLMTEALTLSDAMLAAAPGDVRVLKAKCSLLEDLGRNPAALEIAREINRRAPDDLTEHFRTLRLMSAVEMSSRQIEEWLGQVSSSHPDDPRFELLRASAYALEREVELARDKLDKVLVKCGDSKDPEFVKLLVNELDAALRFSDSLSVLDRCEGAGDPELVRERVRRLWYAGRCKDVVDQTARELQDVPHADAETLSLVVLSMESCGRNADAEPLRRELTNRADPTSEAWRAFLAHSSIDGDAVRGSAAKKQDREALEKAVKSESASPLLLQALGEAQSALGEFDRALESWEAAARSAPSWARPLCRIADALMSNHQDYVALAVARAAVERSPTDAQSIEVYLKALGAVAAVPGELDKVTVEWVRKTMEAFQAELPDRADDILPVYVGLLVRVDKAEAERRIRAVLLTTSARETALLRLAQVAERAGIPLDQNLLDLSESIHGVSPRLALAKAVARARVAGDDAGLRLFDDMRTRAGAKAASLEWELVRTSFLDSARPAEAGPAWVKLADEHPDALEPQLGALASQAAWNDRDAITRIIDRVRSLTGDDGVQWQLARAKWLMSGPAVTEATVAEAASILNGVISSTPRNLSARLLLAQIMEKLGNFTGAEEQLRLAADLRPDNAWISLEIARLAQAQGHSDVMQEQLDKVLKTSDLAPEQVEWAAYLLAVKGDFRRGIDILEPLAARSQTKRDGTVLLAKLYAKLGKYEQAIEACQKLMGTSDAEVIELTAGCYASLGKTSEAEAALSRLASVQMNPGDRELVRVRFAENHGPPGAAGEWYRRALDAAPDRTDAWIAYLRHVITVGDLEHVDAVLRDRRASNVEPVQFLTTERELCAVAVRDERLRTLLLAAIDDPANRTVLIDTIRWIAAAGGEVSHRDEVARKLRGVADTNVRVLAIQIVAAELSENVGEVRVACDIAKRAMSQFPNSAVAAALAAQKLSRAGRWEEALECGLAWRGRTSAQDPQAELAIAESLLRLNRAADAAAGLEPRIAEAMVRPDANTVLIGTYMVALVRSRHADTAKTLLSDLTRRSDLWRAYPMSIGAARLGDAASAVAWLRLCAEFAPESPESQLRLARAWTAAWVKFGTPELFAGAEGVLKRLNSGPDASAESHYVAATLAQRAGKFDVAEEEFAATFARDSAYAPAHNAFAMMLADTGKWKEAIDEARKAVDGAPRNPSYRDTLAYALRSGHDYDNARRECEEAVRLEPQNPLWVTALAETLAEAGKPQDVKVALARIDEMAASGIEMSPAIRKRVDLIRPK